MMVEKRGPPDTKTRRQIQRRLSPDPGMMHSIGEGQDVPKREAAVMPVEGLRKRCRD
jgi:hypothetical protein